MTRDHRGLILGIDLGTTFSAVATCDEHGRPRIVRNRLGAETTPSVVHFDGPGVVEIGAAAADAGPVDPDNTVALIKRQMGRDLPLFFHGVEHTPESVSGLLLRGLVAQARGAFAAEAAGAVRAVVTVPAYFGTREREATAVAAELAGIDVLELLAEPVAAGLHYGLDHTSHSTVLVYDLGGGTFDASILTTGPEGVEVIATDGNHSLGGADVDERLAAVLLDRLADQTGPEDDPRDDDSVVVEARRLAETAKCALSRSERTTMRLRTHRAAVAVTVDRSFLAELCSDLVDRTLDIVDRLLARAGVRPDDVVLVGGATRMPTIGARLAAHLGRQARLLDPDLAVALGAARRAHMLSRPEPRRAIAVLPRGLGVLVRDSHDPDGRREFVRHLLHANAALPARKTVSFATVLPDRPTARIQVHEQAGVTESPEVGDNRLILDGQVTGLDGLPPGSRIDLELSVSSDGRIRLRVSVVGRPDDEVTLEAFVDGVADSATTRALAAITRAMTIRE